MDRRPVARAIDHSQMPTPTGQCAGRRNRRRDGGVSDDVAGPTGRPEHEPEDDRPTPVVNGRPGVNTADTVERARDCFHAEGHHRRAIALATIHQSSSGPVGVPADDHIRGEALGRGQRSGRSRRPRRSPGRRLAASLESTRDAEPRDVRPGLPLQPVPSREVVIVSGTSARASTATPTNAAASAANATTACGPLA